MKVKVKVRTDAGGQRREVRSASAALNSDRIHSNGSRECASATANLKSASALPVKTVKKGDETSIAAADGMEVNNTLGLRHVEDL